MQIQNPTESGLYLVRIRDEEEPRIARFLAKAPINWSPEAIAKFTPHWRTVSTTSVSNDDRMPSDFLTMVESLTGPLVGPDSKEKSLRQIQSEIGEWSLKNFGENVSKRTNQTMGSGNALLGIVEEIGELTHVVLKGHQGIRGYDDPEKYRTERDDAIADTLVYLCDFSHREGVDLLGVLNHTWAKVCLRDWQKNKANADKVVEESLAVNNEAPGKGTAD
jgi:NTP pyrophosphatase (non-canonical NTP hydrolase)